MGSIISLFQANKCRQYTKRLDSIENIDKINQIEKSCKKALAEIRKFGPGQTQKSIKGYNFQKAAKAVQDHLILIKRCKDIFSQELIEQHYNALEESLKQSENNELQAGTQIFQELSSFQAEFEKQRKSELKTIMGA